MLVHHEIRLLQAGFDAGVIKHIADMGKPTREPSVVRIPWNRTANWKDTTAVYGLADDGTIILCIDSQDGGWDDQADRAKLSYARKLAKHSA